MSGAKHLAIFDHYGSNPRMGSAIVFWYALSRLVDGKTSIFAVGVGSVKTARNTHAWRLRPWFGSGFLGSNVPFFRQIYELPLIVVKPHEHNLRTRWILNWHPWAGIY